MSPQILKLFKRAHLKKDVIFFFLPSFFPTFQSVISYKFIKGCICLKQDYIMDTKPSLQSLQLDLMGKYILPSIVSRLNVEQSLSVALSLPFTTSWRTCLLLTRREDILTPYIWQCIGGRQQRTVPSHCLLKPSVLRKNCKLFREAYWPFSLPAFATPVSSPAALLSFLHHTNKSCFLLP